MFIGVCTCKGCLKCQKVGFCSFYFLRIRSVVARILAGFTPHVVNLLKSAKIADAKQRCSLLKNLDM